MAYSSRQRTAGAWALASCLAAVPATAATRMIEVDSRLADCVGVAPAKCLRVRDHSGEPWRLFHGEIEGFTFQPGYRYRLQVEEIPVADPPADASSRRVVLREIVRMLAVEPPADPFRGKVWRLHELVATATATPLRPTAMITLAIDTPAARASGKGGCNRWFGTAKVDGLRLTLSGMGATTMAFPSPAMEEERAFLAALARTLGYAVDELGLTLTLAEGGELRFRELLD